MTMADLCLHFFLAVVNKRTHEPVKWKRPILLFSLLNETFYKNIHVNLSTVQCSVSCGEGQQRYAIHCVLNNVSVNAALCGVRPVAVIINCTMPPCEKKVYQQQSSIFVSFVFSLFQNFYIYSLTTPFIYTYILNIHRGLYFPKINITILAFLFLIWNTFQNNIFSLYVWYFKFDVLNNLALKWIEGPSNHPHSFPMVLT